jgi:hypothetical protein
MSETPKPSELAREAAAFICCHDVQAEGARDAIANHVQKAIDRTVAEALALYNELIMAVERKHEGETRHQTALRYIREAESDAAQSACGPLVAALDRIALSYHPKLVNCEVAWQEVAGFAAATVAAHRSHTTAPGGEKK